MGLQQANLYVWFSTVVTALLAFINITGILTRNVRAGNTEDHIPNADIMAELFRPLVPTQVTDFPIQAVSRINKTAKIKCFNGQRPGEMSNLFTGITCLSNDIVVCDHENKSVKRFTFSGQFIESLNLSDPSGISAIPKSSDVVITEPAIQQLTFCSLEGNIKVTSVSRTSKKYECIRAVDELKFVVGCCALGAASVDVVDPNGNILRSIHNVEKECTLFRNPAAISCLTSGEILISDPGCSLLICISPEGKTLFKYDPNGRPSGICTDQHGSIYMAQYDANMVYRLSSDGKKESVIVNDDINITSPMALAVSPDGNYLVMTEDFPSERIVIIKLPGIQDRHLTDLSLGNVMVRLNSSHGFGT